MKDERPGCMAEWILHITHNYMIVGSSLTGATQ